MAQEPVQRFFASQRLRLSSWDWGNERAPTLVLVHGGRDQARSWDRIADAFREDYLVVAPDLRGHGDSAWTPGGNYGLPDNALDLVRLIETAGPWSGSCARFSTIADFENWIRRVFLVNIQECLCRWLQQGRR